MIGISNINRGQADLFGAAKVPIEVTSSTDCLDFQGARRRINSALFTPLIVSARALSSLSLRLSIEA